MVCQGCFYGFRFYSFSQLGGCGGRVELIHVVNKTRVDINLLENRCQALFIGIELVGFMD